MAVTVRCGADSRSAAGESDGSSASREPRDHTTASAPRRSSCTPSMAAASPGSTTTLRFDEARNANSAPSSPWGMAAPEADQRRSGSPSGASTLTTSAPPSARSFVQ